MGDAHSQLFVKAKKGDFKMPKNTGIAPLVEELITPKVNELGLDVWDVEYVKEGAEW